MLRIACFRKMAMEMKWPEDRSLGSARPIEDDGGRPGQKQGAENKGKGREERTQRGH